MENFVVYTKSYSPDVDVCKRLKETVEGIRLQPLERRFRINHLTGEELNAKS